MLFLLLPSLILSRLSDSFPVNKIKKESKTISRRVALESSERNSLCVGSFEKMEITRSADLLLCGKLRSRDPTGKKAVAGASANAERNKNTALSGCAFWPLAPGHGNCVGSAAASSLSVRSPPRRCGLGLGPEPGPPVVRRPQAEASERRGERAQLPWLPTDVLEVSRFSWSGWVGGGRDFSLVRVVPGSAANHDA